MRSFSPAVHKVAEFLGAYDYQVEMWDSKVINHLADNPSLLSEFERGSDFAKWDIYSTAKFG